jgi:hypothetical protein
MPERGILLRLARWADVRIDSALHGDARHAPTLDILGDAPEVTLEDPRRGFGRRTLGSLGMELSGLEPCD